MVKETLASKAYNLLRDDIRSQRIKPGKTIVEKDICRRYSVSKATAGEVLHRLTEEGIMRAFPRKGYQLNIYDDKDYIKIQELRYALESLVVHRVVLGVNTEKLRSAFEKIDEMANDTFHLTLASLANDEFILDSLSRLLLKVGTTYGNLVINPEDEAAVIQRHRAIIDRLIEKDEQGALNALREDLRIDKRSSDGSTLLITQKRLFTTEMIPDLVYICDPQLSPDGHSAAYTRWKARTEDGKFYAQAVLRDLKTGSETLLGQGNNNHSIRFAPSGKFLCYLSDSGGEMQIVIRFADGREKQLTSLRHGIVHYAISPAEDTFVFEANLWPDEVKDGVQFTVMLPDEKKAWLEAREWAPLEITQIDYKRDECKGVRDGSIGMIGIVSLSGEQRLLTKDVPHQNPVFSPDGAKIACYGNPHSGARFSRRELFLVDTETGEKVCLTGDEFLSCDAPAVFTEDGSEIIYPAWFMRDNCMITYLYKRPVNGGDPVCLFDPNAEEICSGVYGMPLCRTQYGEEKPYFTVKGDWIWFLSMWDGKERLFKVPVKGGSVKPVLEYEGSIHEFCLPVRKKWLLSMGDPHTPRSLYLYDERTKTFSCIVEADPWLKGCELGEVTAYDIPSSDGKGSVYGWVCKPAGFDKNKKYPAVLYLHGGPEVCYTHDFWHEIQALAGAGFAVVYCDPRGSAGHGLNHCNEEDSWNDTAYRDMMDFLDHAISLGFIDPDRVGITGGSYGGYMTCKIIMMDHRFKAAVGQRVFVNKATSYGTGDMGFYSARETDDKPDVKKWLMQRSRTSIIRNMDKIKTPLLLLHGYQDYRCSYEQAEQMFISIHERIPDLPVRLVMFPGENHNVSRTGLIHFQQRHVQEMVDWFTKYLKEDPDNEA